MTARIPVLSVSARALVSVGISTALAIMGKDAIAASHQVTTCNSTGAGSLSAVLAAASTVNGDTIDLTPLKHVCSKISVADLPIHQDNLFLQGPGAKYLAVDAGHHGRVFNHDGMGTLVITGISITNGKHSAAAEAKGGCLYSTGSISLVDSQVAQCAVESTTNRSLGGAIYTQGDLHLLRSHVTGNKATASGAVLARGGGSYSGGAFAALYSTVSDNIAGVGTDMGYGVGGGAMALGDVDIEHSTISNNKADAAGGLFLNGGSAHTATILDSTVSGNSASHVFGGVSGDEPLSISNSTIVFNRAGDSVADQEAGIFAMAPIDLESSIIAGNSGQHGPNDLAVATAVSVTGSNNLIFKPSLALPMNNTTGVCPKLDVLADNGGFTLTHGLKPTSPAIDKGSAPMSLTLDQRLEARVTGPQPDIGAVEYRQTDVLEGVFVGGFDGLCDR